MDVLSAVREAKPRIEKLATFRYRTDTPEIAELNERHRYFTAYAIGRTAPFTGAGAHVVHALLGLFPWPLVRKTVERTEEADALREAYVDACSAAGDRLFGDLPDAAELADRLEQLVDACRFADRPLAAGWRDLPAPAGVGARIERAATVLREHRGNAHIAILQTHGLLGPDALLVSVLSAGRDDPEGHARFFGWRDDDIAAAWERLRAAGRVEDRQLTERGREEREAIEDLTAALALEPWRELSSDDRVRTVELLHAARAALG